MLNRTWLRKWVVPTILFFAWACLAPDLLRGQEEDPLQQAQRAIKAGNYTEAARILNQYIDKIKGIAKQKGKVAEAFYQLAKMYYEVGDDAKCHESLRQVYTYDPEFFREETNPELWELTDSIRKEMGIAKPDKQVALEKKVIEMSKSFGKKKKKFPWLLLAAGAVAIVLLTVVFSGKLKKKYTLTARVQEGINGDPETGTYSYEKGAIVSYEYYYSESGNNFEVKIDGSVALAKGTLTMDRDHLLEVNLVPVNALETIEVDSRNNSIQLRDSCAAILAINMGIHSVSASGNACYSPGLAMDSVILFYSNSSGYLDLEILRIGGSNKSIEFTAYSSYLVLADWDNLEDNSGQVQVSFDSQSITLDARQNCFNLRSSPAARKELAGMGSVRIRSTGKAYRNNSIYYPFYYTLIAYIGSDGRHHIDAVPNDDTIAVSIGAGPFFAFFVDDFVDENNSGKVTLQIIR